jgi:tetratricopeptide (TPR) repeat protein
MRQIHYFFAVIVVLCACKKQPTDPIENDNAAQITAKYGCAAPDVLDRQWYDSNKKAPSFSGLDGIQFEISTRNPEAQKYFSQGLMLSFGFNHAEAGRSFYEAARQDPNCAMCWWGFAYVLGPNYNAGMEKDNFQRAFDAIQKARKLAAQSSQKEKDLIEALAERYAKDTTIARPTLDSAYAVAMRKVYKKYPNDATIGVLFAESLMDLHPWNLFQKDGKSQPWTPEIITVLEKSIKIEPNHAGANHFYIHATEMSSRPETALKSADLLRNLVPGSGHMLHMPSHVYIRIGRYHDGVATNEEAVRVDSLYTVACNAQGVYPLAYYPHNYHFIAACGTLSGESKVAMAGANATANHAHQKLMRDPAWATLQHYYTIPWYVDVKFGAYGKIRKTPAPQKDLKYPLVIWHYAQGMMELSGKDVSAAKKHLAQMKTVMKDPALAEMTIWGINKMTDLCDIGAKILEGEIAAKEYKYAEAISLLRQAVAKEDALNYNEPPDWFFSVRHHLGAVLIDAGKFHDAIKIYNEDLKNYPENGWALAGMMNAYQKLGDKKKYTETKTRFEAAWKYADIKIASSRLL